MPDLPSLVPVHLASINLTVCKPDPHCIVNWIHGVLPSHALPALHCCNGCYMTPPPPPWEGVSTLTIRFSWVSTFWLLLALPALLIPGTSAVLASLHCTCASWALSRLHVMPSTALQEQMCVWFCFGLLDRHAHDVCMQHGLMVWSCLTDMNTRSLHLHKAMLCSLCS